MHMLFYKRFLVFTAILAAIFSCDSDFNELGADIIGQDNFEYGTPETYAVNAFNINTGAVESINLPINPFGIFSDPIYGPTKFHLVTQLQLASPNPTIDLALVQVIDSVILKIPYFSTRTSGPNENNNSVFKLDSLYSATTSKLKLGIYESNFYLRDIDPLSVTPESQKYYTDQNGDFAPATTGLLLNNDNSGLGIQNDNFVFDSSEIKEKTTGEGGVVSLTRSAPAMRLKLDTNFFKNKIFTNSAGKLINNNVFKEYFRGLYFNVENSTGDPNMAMIDFKKGNITIYYKENESLTSLVQVNKTLVLRLDGKSVSLQERTQRTFEENKLFLRGGEGAMTVIDLFGRTATGDGNTPTLSDLRAKKWLVNDASLTFFIDSDAMTNAVYEPSRIYLYDLTNKRPLVDYYNDRNTSSSKPKFSKSVFGGIIKKTNGRGTEYKIRLTNHIQNLIKNADSTNVRLGLVVTENILSDLQVISNKKLKTPITSFGISTIPTASVFNPLGTILFGSGDNVPLDKRVQLKIYFTKPKQN